MMNKSPGFQFYPDKWLAGTTHLDAEAYRAYHRVLCWMWLNSQDQCSIPDTDEAWRMATGLDNSRLIKVRKIIQNSTHPMLRQKNGKLVSNGLKKEAIKQKAYKQKQSDIAKSRWNKEVTTMPPHKPPHKPPQCQRTSGGISDGNASRRQCSPSSSPSSSPTPISSVILSEEVGRGEGDRTPEYPVDYGNEPTPEIRDYQDINDPTNDPILVAIAITGERTVQSWGYWVKAFNRLRRENDMQRANEKFRGCLRELWGEIKQGECQKPGACLNLKLKQVFGT